MRSLGYGFYDGYVGMFTEPYKGARDHGALGLLTGFAKGCSGFITHPHSAIFGVVAYPALGLYRSLNTNHVTGAQGAILNAQKAHGQFLAENSPVSKKESSEIIWMFNLASKGTSFGHDDRERSNEIGADETQYPKPENMTIVRGGGRVEENLSRQPERGSSPETDESTYSASTAPRQPHSHRAQMTSPYSTNPLEFNFNRPYEPQTPPQDPQKGEAMNMSTSPGNFSISHFEDSSATKSLGFPWRGHSLPVNENQWSPRRSNLPSFDPDTAHHGPTLNPRSENMPPQPRKAHLFTNESTSQRSELQLQQSAELASPILSTSNNVKDSTLSDQEVRELNQAIQESMASKDELIHAIEQSLIVKDGLALAIEESIRDEVERQATEKQELDEVLHLHQNGFTGGDVR
jgi:hypothetical protein